MGNRSAAGGASRSATEQLDVQRRAQDRGRAPRANDAWAPTQEVLRLLRRKWVVPILSVLGKGPMRYSHLKPALGGISPKVLTETLRALERDGMVSRVFFDDPYGHPAIGYELTGLGRTLSRPLGSLHAWGVDHLADVRAARNEKDGMR